MCVDEEEENVSDFVYSEGEEIEDIEVCIITLNRL